jgi:hypothetical protein
MHCKMYVLIQLAVSKHVACGATTWLQTELLFIFCMIRGKGYVQDFTYL